MHHFFLEISMVCSSMQDKNKMQSIAAVETKGTYAVTITEICDKVTRRASNHTCREELRSWLVVVWMLFTACLWRSCKSYQFVSH